MMNFHDMELSNYIKYFFQQSFSLTDFLIFKIISKVLYNNSNLK